MFLLADKMPCPVSDLMVSPVLSQSKAQNREVKDIPVIVEEYLKFLRINDFIIEKSADVWGIEKVWGALYEAARQHGDFQTKKSDSKLQHFQWFDLWEMKNFVRRWWKEHSNPEFCHSIVAGTMRRMHQMAKRKGLPVCSYYKVSWALLYCMILYA